VTGHSSWRPLRDEALSRPGWAALVADERAAALAEIGDDPEEWTVELEAVADEPPQPEEVQGVVDAALARHEQSAKTVVTVRSLPAKTTVNVAPDGKIILAVVVILAVGGAIAMGLRRRAVHDVAGVVALSLERFGPVVSERIKSAA
jgi:hypothetical protein